MSGNEKGAFHPRIIMFDLDGTLVDSVADLATAIDQTMLELGRSTHGVTKVRQWVGNGVPMLIKRALSDSMAGKADPAEFELARPIFARHYQASLAQYSKLYEGVKGTLTALLDNGYQLVCITNKAIDFTLPLLENLGIGECFQHIIAGDTLAVKKPDPGQLLHAAELCQMAISDCLMVGDSKNDVNAARAAGCPVVAVSYGYNHGEDIRLAKPDRVIDHFSQLLELINLKTLSSA